VQKRARGATITFAALLGASLALTTPLPAAALSFSLWDLEQSSGSFDSGNAELSFGNFQAQVSGLPFWISEQTFLQHSVVTQLEDGLKIFAPLIAFGLFNHVDLELKVDFDVWAAEGLEIAGASIGLWGIELGDAEAYAMSSIWNADLLAELFVEVDGFFDWDSDSVVFDEGHAHLSIEDLMAAEACGCGIGAAKKLYHHFDTALIPAHPSVPEPGAALLLASGLLGLRLTRRHREQR
jgi:hypothetical protein